ncbi:MAG: GAF domain-containing protein [Proteobacteria bacterium]|nr:GAF domain-containing protein [Pseudomonadota bacterium]
MINETLSTVIEVVSCSHAEYASKGPRMPDHYQTILKINNAIIHCRTRQDLFNEIARVLKDVFRFDRIAILIDKSAEKEWHYFTPAVGVSIPGMPKDVLPVVEEMIPYQAMREKRIVVADLREDPDRSGNREALEVGLVSMISGPLIIRDQVLGSVQLFYKESFPLSREEVELFEKVSSQLALAVDNMRAYETLKSTQEKLVEEKSILEKEIETLGESDHIVFAERKIGRLMDDVENVAATDITVLLTGETGTGKDLIARRIHNSSRRRNNTFFKLNCAALVPTLIESELFGHEKGAFTGANACKIGRFELAGNSTLFLDEITELPINTQAKLLQVLQDSCFERVGGSETLTTDARIIAAGNQDFKSLIEQKKFREDLYYRLNIFPIHVPPLRERVEDIPLLLSHFVEKSSSRLQRRAPDFDKTAIQALVEYEWPGNIRELENLVERIVIIRSNREVTGNDIRTILPTAPGREKSIRTLDEAEKDHIESILKKTRGKVAGPGGAAELLGVKRPKLQYRMKRLGMTPSDFR